MSTSAKPKLPFLFLFLRILPAFLGKKAENLEKAIFSHLNTVKEQNENE